MFAITIELLAGRYVATAYNDRDRVEWPPHPARLFSALVATWAEGDPASGDGEGELQALRWLERQAAPAIWASPFAEAGLRKVVPMFVPVNDVSVVSSPGRDKLDDAEAALSTSTDAKSTAKLTKDVEKLRQKLLDDTVKATAVPTKAGKGDADAGHAVMLERRTKQPRTFPSATPAHPALAFQWDGVDVPSELRAGLDRLVGRLVRLGHSSTLVRASVANEAAMLADIVAKTTCHVEDSDHGDLVIRWVAAGQVERLGRAFDLHKETEPRVLPARFVRYRQGQRTERKPVPHGVLGRDLIVFARVDGPRLPSTSTVGLARQLRRALMAAAEQPVHEVISGHHPDGAASTKPHLAILPLPVVTGPHPDGSIIGVALSVPRDCTPEERTAIMKAVANLERQNVAATASSAPAVIPLRLGEAGVLGIQRIDFGEDRRSTLRASTWCRPSMRWASATAVALDRNPGDLHDANPAKRQQAFDAAVASVRASVLAQGLPEPIEIDVVRSCVVPGTAKPLNYPRFPISTDRPQRVLVHVRLLFAEPVAGPVVLGAGRFHGLGLLLPVDDRAALGVST